MPEEPVEEEAVVDNTIKIQNQKVPIRRAAVP
jgi:hypothetical protein